jgi:exodeoxyribonuclease V gamma subunit
MPNHLYISNSIEKLALQLSQNLQQETCDVFQQQHIITQTEGMNKWLTEQIAQQLGISANIGFHSPNDIIALLHEWLSEKPGPVITSDKIRWKIWKELSEPGFRQRFPEVAAYYRNHPIRQIALANQMADLFDQYQIYRPGLISDWNHSAQSPENFQWYLWKRLQQAYQGRVSDKPSVVNKLKEALKNPTQEEQLNKRVAGLHFFGIAVITPLHLELFQLLAAFIPLHFYLMNPAPSYYWLEDETEKSLIKKRQKNKLRQPEEGFNLPGNSLLTGWGTVIKESFALLYQQEELMNEVYDHWIVPPADNPTSLLHKIQKDIFENAHGTFRQPISLENFHDGSIVFNSCYTKAREVEVLYNELVKIVNARPGELAPKDILVLCSNMDDYAPYIRAVFDEAPYDFPYTLSDQKITEGASLFSDLQRLLELNSDNMKAEIVMELLESKNISQRFGISQPDLIRSAMQAANIRCGTAGEIENDTRLVSWEYGLQRIALGWCISGSPIYNAPSGDTLIPIDIAEGDTIFELVRFHQFATLLLHHIELRKSSRSLSEWINYVRELIADMLFVNDDQDAGDYHDLIAYLDKYNQHAEDISDLVPFDVFAYQFTATLQSETRQQNFGRGGVLFCSLIPMRSIPHKVVAILGMNYNEFPRKDTRPHFDLQKNNPGKGDRNIRNNDKHLLLETLLSAKEHLLISYQGQDVKDNRPIPPSALVDELINYILEGLPQTDYQLRKKLIVSHPLHSFSSRYGSDAADGLTSYLSSGAQSPLVKKTMAPVAANTVNNPLIELSSLTKFAKSPITWYLQKNWRISAYTDDILLSDIESFEIGKLEKSNLTAHLLQFSPASYDNFYQEWLLQGKLPLSNRGKFLYQQLAQEVRILYESREAITGGQPARKIEVTLDFGVATLSGIVEGVYGNQLIGMQTSSKLKKDFFPAFINYCCLRAQDLPITFHFFKQKGEWVTCEANELSVADANAFLLFFLDKFLHLAERPFLFFPEWKKSNVMLYFKNGVDDYVIQLADEVKGSRDKYKALAKQAGYFSGEYFDEVKEHVDFVYPFLKRINAKFFT